MNKSIMGFAQKIFFGLLVLSGVIIILSEAGVKVPFIPIEFQATFLSIFTPIALFIVFVYPHKLGIGAKKEPIGMWTKWGLILFNGFYLGLWIYILLEPYMISIASSGVIILSLILIEVEYGNKKT